MELTVKKLKEILSQVNDDVLIADLDFGNDNFYPQNYIKRILLLEDKRGNQYLTINRMGSHFTGEGTQAGLKVIGHCDDSGCSFTNDNRNVAGEEEKSIKPKKCVQTFGACKQPFGTCEEC